MKKVFVLIISVALCAAALLPVIVRSQGQSQQHSSGSQAEIQKAIHHDVSPPLRDITSPPRSDVPREKPLRSIPHAVQNVQDPVVQTTVGPLVNTTTGLNIAGVGNGDYGFVPNAAPPDTNASVGATQVVQWLNESFAVVDTTTG